MPREGSVTRWIGDLSDGKEAAVGPLWSRYFPRATGIVRRLIARGWRWRHADDAEDVAVSALHTLIERVRDGRLVVRDGRKGWNRLLAVITRHKAARRCRQPSPGRVPLDSVVVPDPGAGPAEQIQGRDRLEAILDRLDREPGELRAIAELCMAGYNQGEIAEELGVTRRTVVRRMATIRKLLIPGENPGPDAAPPEPDGGELAP
jgi:DNA-directed RNA polymerase specialized sigma24 family protein